MLENASFEKFSSYMATSWLNAGDFTVNVNNGTVTDGITDKAHRAGSYSLRISGDGSLSKGVAQTVAGTLTVGITSAVLAIVTKTVGTMLTTTKLYCYVSSAETSGFIGTGKLSAGAGETEGDFFATVRADAKTWGAKLCSDNIISIRVSK